MENHSAQKEDKPAFLVGKCMHPETVTLGEINQTHVLQYHMVSCMRNPKDEKELTGSREMA